MKQKILKSAVALVLMVVMVIGAVPIFGLLGLLPQSQAAGEFYTEPMIVAGDDGNTAYSLALRSDGTVWVWGNNYCNQLGNYDYIYMDSTSIPIQVKNLDEIIDVDVCFGRSLALRSDGTVWTWP